METPQKKDKTHDKHVRRDAFKKLGLILVAVLIVVNTIQLARFGDIVERVDLYNKGVIDEIGGIRQDVVSFGNDLNEIRSFLLLPTKDYSFSTDASETQDTTEEKPATRTESALYTFLGQMTEEQNLQKNARLAQSTGTALASDAAFAADLNKAGFKIGKIEDSADAVSFKISDSGGSPLFAFMLDKKTAKPALQSVLGTHGLTSTDIAGMKTELLDYITKNKDQVSQLKNLINGQKTAIESFAANNDLAAVFKQKNVTLSAAEDAEESINYNLVNADGDKLLTIQIQRKDGQLVFDGKTYKTAADLLPAFLEKAKNVDAESAQDKLISARRTELEGIFNQPAFLDLLKNSGLTLTATPREEYNKLLYDVKDAQGKTVFSFDIEISSGSYKILKDNQEIDLYSVLDDGSKKKP